MKKLLLFVVRLFLIPVLLSLLLLKYILKWFGRLGHFIFCLISGLALIFGTVELFEAWRSGSLIADFMSYGLTFLMGFIFSTLSVVVIAVPSVLEVITNKMISFIFNI